MAGEGPRDLFPGHRCSLQVVGGAYWATSLGPQGPPLNYAPIAVRLGYQLNERNPDCLLTIGTWEAIVEGMVAPTLTNFGSHISGGSLLLRGNLSQLDWPFIPFFQFGAGIVYTDASHRYNQFEIGEEAEFLLQAAVGGRVRIGENWTLDVEAGFQHISNAGLARHNGGINNVGASIGLTYFFPGPR
jgi:hypothetical protein